MGKKKKREERRRNSRKRERREVWQCGSLRKKKRALGEEKELQTSMESRARTGWLSV